MRFSGHQVTLHRPRGGWWSATWRFLVVLLGPGAALGAVPEDAEIINQASVEYSSGVTGQWTKITSDPVRVTLQPMESMRLVEDRTVKATSGQQVHLAHRLINDGRLTQTVTFQVLNQGGDDFDLDQMQLVWDQNGNGRADPEEPVLVDATRRGADPATTLASGEYRDLVIVGSVPAVGEANRARVKLTVVNSTATIALENNDLIITTAQSTFSFFKEASNLNPSRGSEVLFTLSGRAGNQGIAQGFEILVDGQPQSYVVVRDAIPANMSFARVEELGGGVALYHLQGRSPHVYQTTPPADLREVDAIGFGLPAQPAGATFRVSFYARVNDNANGTLRNVGHIFFADGVNTPPTDQSSNPVDLVPDGQPPAIRYYTDPTFTQIAEWTTLGSQLRVQADAAACNFFFDIAETNTIIITSKLTGDREVYPAVETGPNTGVFRVLADVFTQDATQFVVIRGDGQVQTLKDDELEASIEGCGSSRTATRILIDPLGVVFDSVSNQPVAGARVTLFNAVTGEPAIVFAADGVTPAPSQVVTGADGRFLFPTVAPGQYQLVVVPPPGYAGPSLVAPMNLPANRAIDPAGSYGGVFRIDVRTGAVKIDYPLDPIRSDGSPGFFLSKIASAREAELGDGIEYEVAVKNVTGAVLPAVQVRDQLPVGFRYQAGSARLDGRALPEPAAEAPSTLQFVVGDLADGKTVRLTYRVRLGPDARSGDGINRARAASGGPVPQFSNEARAEVKLREGVFTTRGVIFGKVFVDLDRNRVQDPEEPGIPGVRLYLEDGTFIITDSEGKYSFYGVSARTHVLKLDWTTLPRGSRLEETSNRNVGDPESRLVDLKFGEMHKANFAEASGDPKVLQEVLARRSRGEVVGPEFERALKLPLTQERWPIQVGDVRAQPASGIMGGGVGVGPGLEQAPVGPARPGQPTPATGTNAPAIPAQPGSAVASSTSAPTAGVTPAAPPATTNAPSSGFTPVLPPDTLNGANSSLPGTPVARIPQIPLEAVVTNLDNQLGFIDLRDGDTLPMAQATVRVKGTQGASLELAVNGQIVPDSRIGKKVVLTSARLEAWEYVSVALRPGTNQLELLMRDPFGNARGTNVIHVLAPDKLGRIKILVPKKEAVADGVTPVRLLVRLEDANGTPVTARTPLTLETGAGRWDVTDLDRREPGVQVFLEGGAGEFPLLPPQEPGDAEIVVSSGILKTRAAVSFLPDLRPLIGSGVLEGTVNISRLGRGSFSPANSRDGFEEELRSFAASGKDGQVTTAGRGAFFLKGKIKGEYLLTAAYDSEKDTTERLFRDIQPDEFYPVYGDSSVRGYDAQSSGRLYLRIDKRRSYLLLGDFTTQTTSEVRGLGNYSRSLNGVREHYEKKNIRANAWAAYDTTRQVVEELPANGTSGPYNFKTANGLVNSEKVEILTRDRNQPSIILKSTPMVRFTDYEFEPFTGRLLFRAPVPSLDSNLNPISIRITYEVDQGGDKFWVYGADAQVKVTPGWEVGGSAMRDENEFAPHQLYSANSTVRLNEKTHLLGEVAQSESDLVGTGRAGRLDLRHQSAKTDARLYYGMTEANFTNIGSIMMPGRIEGGGKISQRLSRSDRLIGEGIWTEDQFYDGLRRGVRADWEHVFTNGMRLELGARHSVESATPASPSMFGVGPNEVTSLRTKFTTSVPKVKNLSVYGEYENDVVEPDKRMVAVGGDYQLNTKLKAYARHEFIDALGSPFELNNQQQNNRTVVGLDTEYMRDGHLFNEYRMRDAITGREAEAATGLRNGWNVAEGLRLNTSFEKINTLQGSGQNEATALAGGLEYTRNPLWKGSARLELRTSPTADSLLNTLGYAYKISDDWTFLSRSIVYLVESPSSQDRRQGRVQVGMAYRQTDTDRWSGLVKFETKYESGVPDLPLKDLERMVYQVNLDVNYQPVRDWTFSLHYGGKLAEESDPLAEVTYHAHLFSGRIIYELSRRWDVGLVGSTLFERNFSSVHYGLGPEVGFTFHRNVRLGLGYNFFGFKDRDFNAEYTNPGVYVSMQVKFDETFLGMRKRGDE